ncbi:hypothetical protein [Salaquimonas pukyongi]|uniref:hypothetical protein n=1 Tax=Salaquimonas pukyongi TaxID=2712698 RepID=UPI001967C896|nr:hypothetical protein [Salaquimonas pukyongi]
MTLDKVRKEGTLKRGSFVLEWQPGRASALDSSRIAEGRDIGNLIVQETDGGNRRDAVHDITFAFVAHAFHPDLKIEQ